MTHKKHLHSELLSIDLGCGISFFEEFEQLPCADLSQWVGCWVPA